jgi:hypothetical protein
MCRELKSEDDFAWQRIAENTRDSYCRSCRAAYKQMHYAANKARYKGNASAYTWRMALLRTAWLFDYFTTHPCTDCGESDPLVLEFDHLGDKRFSISIGMRKKSWDAVLAEIEKCEVVCANCHRKRTALRGGFARLRV